jgi:hypothetical protein
MGSEKEFRCRPADFLRGRVWRKALERTGMETWPCYWECSQRVGEQAHVCGSPMSKLRILGPGGPFPNHTLRYIGQLGPYPQRRPQAETEFLLVCDKNCSHSFSHQNVDGGPAPPATFPTATRCRLFLLGKSTQPVISLHVVVFYRPRPDLVKKLVI